jgi:alpha-beta hydrolase superfamily lysophospholipase
VTTANAGTSDQLISRADLASPSDTAATGGRHFGGSQLKAALPPGIDRELISLTSEDGATHAAAAYRATNGTPRTGVILMHPVADFTQHYALAPLAQRGYLALGVRSRFSDDSNALVEQAVLDLASGVRYLREQGCERVVLLGNSGGGGLACFYQAEAEDPSVASTPAGDPPDLRNADLPAADALVLLNAHRGRAQVLTGYLDASVVDEKDPVATDPDLDMFNPQHGPPYSEEFVRRYKAAQIDRNERITAWARMRLEELAELGYDDEAFVIHRTTAALEFLDPAVDPSDRPLGWYGGENVQWFNRAAIGLGRFATLRSWLSQFGLSSTNALAEPNLARTSVPVLVVQGTADQGVFNTDARALFDAAGTADKTLHWSEGGLHFFAGQPDHQAAVLDEIDNWLTERGLGSPR